MPYDYGDETGYRFEGIGGSQERNGGLMEAALVLARFWGIIVVVLCVLSMLLNAKFYVRVVKAFQDESVRFLYYFIVLVIGAMNVSFLNEWALNLRVSLHCWG